MQSVVIPNSQKKKKSKRNKLSGKTYKNQGVCNLLDTPWLFSATFVLFFILHSSKSFRFLSDTISTRNPEVPKYYLWLIRAANLEWLIHVLIKLFRENSYEFASQFFSFSWQYSIKFGIVHLKNSKIRCRKKSINSWVIPVKYLNPKLKLFVFVADNL